MVFKKSNIPFKIEEEELSDLTEENFQEFIKKLKKLFNKKGIKLDHYESVSDDKFWLIYGEDMEFRDLTIYGNTRFDMEFSSPLYIIRDTNRQTIKFKFIDEKTLYIGLRDLPTSENSPSTEHHDLYIVK